MTSTVYPVFVKALLAGAVNLTSDRLRMMLLTDGYKFSKEHKAIEEISPHEIQLTGYEPGGNNFEVKIKESRIFAAPVVWPVSIHEASSAVVYLGESLPVLWTLLSGSEPCFVVAFAGNAFLEIRS